eukprot:5234766-Amphidinium_carterae.1
MVTAVAFGGVRSFSVFCILGDRFSACRVDVGDLPSWVHWSKDCGLPWGTLPPSALTGVDDALASFDVLTTSSANIEAHIVNSLRRRAQD